MIKFANLIVLSLFIFSLLLPHLACKISDVPSQTADEIILLAKNVSPDCPAPAEPGG